MNYKLISPPTNSSVIETILNNRGIYDVEHYLNTTEQDNLNPTLLMNIDEAIKIFVKHLMDNKYIYLIVDPDTDGFCSNAILLNYLYQIFPSIVETKFRYNFHDSKYHGIELDLIPDNVGLVLALDCSSNDYEIHETLQNAGIDVIVIDHHKADYISQYACVINNQLCDYPTKSLCGGAMTYKFCKRFDQLFGFDYADTQLDMVALSLISDMMSMKDFETKYLITKGLENISNPFFTKMIEKNSFQFQNGITPIGIAFYITPYINSVTRVGELDENLILFEAMLSWKALELIKSTKRGFHGSMETRVEQAVRNCTNIKNRQTKLRDSCLDTIENKIERENLLAHKLLIITLNQSDINKSLTGLVANQLSNKYQRPSMVLIKNDETNSYGGSARGYNKSGLENFRYFVLESGLAQLAEGHPNAFGTVFNEDNLNKFIDYADAQLPDIDENFSPSYNVDFIYSMNNLNAQHILYIANLKELWGQEVEEPYLAIENVPVTADKIKLMGVDKGKPTIKITLPNGVEIIKFKSSEEEYNSLFSQNGCVIINLIATCELNEWNGKITPQLNMQDYEIISRQQYYF